jgi:hypothetical protein
MRKYFVVIVTCFINYCYAQTYHCSKSITPNTITTDWRVTNTINTWDWTQEFYNDAYIKNRNLPSVIKSPFYPAITGQNLNLEPFYSAYSNKGYNGLDFHPEDGWELLIKDFGYCNTSPCNNATAVNNPFFVLYNRYLGLMRAFFMVSQSPGTANGARVLLSFKGADRENALLSHAYPTINALEDFTKGIVFQNANRYSNEDDYWLYADFPMAYDPCICNYPSKITFEFDLITNWDVSLQGNMWGTFKQIIGPNNNNVNTSSPYKSLLDFSNNIINAGTKSYKEWETYKIETEKFIDNIDPSISSLMTDELGLIKELASPLPYVGTFLGLYDYFASGGKQTIETKKPEPLAFEVDLNFSASGLITSNNPYGTRTFWVPGSNINATGQQPKYNNLVGIFNIPKTPILEYVDYEPNSYATTIDPITGNTVTKALPYIRKYKLKDEIKYVFNRASNLTIDSINACYVLKYGNAFNDYSFLNIRGILNYPKPVAFGTPPHTISGYDDEIRRAGFEYELLPKNNQSFVKATLRTPYTPITCFKLREFYLFSGETSGGSYSSYSMPTILLKVVVKLHRNDNQGQSVLLTFTYPVNLVQGTTTNGTSYDVKQASNIDYITGTCYYPDKILYTNPPSANPYSTVNLTFTNQIISQNQYASNNINLNNGTIINNNVVIRAGSNINVSDINNINPNAILEIGLPFECDKSLNELEYSDAELNSLCSVNSPYEVRSRLTKTNLANIKQNKIIENAVNLYPNPSNDFTQLYYSLEKNSSVTISVFDLSGNQILNVIDNKVQEVGEHIEYINTQSLSAGIYFIRLNTADGYGETKKLLIAK